MRERGHRLLGTLDYGSIRGATATMGYKYHALSDADANRSLTVPTYMLKYGLGYDITMQTCELSRISATNVTIVEAWTGPARLQLFDHVLAPLADLPVREVVSASHITADLNLGQFEPVHDYLA